MCTVDTGSCSYDMEFDVDVWDIFIAFVISYYQRWVSILCSDRD